MSIVCRNAKVGSGVVVDVKLNVLSSQYTNGIFYVAMEVSDLTGRIFKITSEGIKPLPWKLLEQNVLAAMSYWSLCKNFREYKLLSFRVCNYFYTIVNLLKGRRSNNPT
jgi:hypothetical protein